MATVTIKQAEYVAPPVEGVTLELSLDDALWLAAALRDDVTGYDPIYESLTIALSTAGIDYIAYERPRD